MIIDRIETLALIEYHQRRLANEVRTARGLIHQDEPQRAEAHAALAKYHDQRVSLLLEYLKGLPDENRS